MCIYCGTKYYRKIYEEHNGPIPKDKDGRTYDIHHIDGDHSNNEPDNLKAVTIQEHYDIHDALNDTFACWKLAGKMKLSPAEISILAQRNANKQVLEGTHPFLGGEMQRQMIADGTHPFVGGEVQRKTAKKNVAAGTHNTYKKKRRH